jgi:hypothetical protein
MNTVKIELWWTAAGCLPDADQPAHVANSFDDARAWIAGDEAAAYWETTGEHNTYCFELIPTPYATCPTCHNEYPTDYGQPVPWDVMGDPRPTITVCPECATHSINHQPERPQP